MKGALLLTAALLLSPRAAAAAADTFQDTIPPVPPQDPAPGSAVQDSLYGWGAVVITDTEVGTFIGTPEKAAWVRYLDMELTAGVIHFDFERNLLTAVPLEDTTATGEIKQLHRPVFRQRDQRVEGDRMEYDLEAEKGVVFGADTTYEQGFYHGLRITAVHDDPDYLLVRDARFTTCDLEEPHYHFTSTRMKIVPEDKVIGRPVIMYIWGIPVAGLPLLVRSIRTGRQSGLLAPKFGTTSLYGSTIRDLGYYWAPSEYFDSRLALDLTSEQGILLRSRTRYAWRYRLQGNLDIAYNKDRRQGLTRTETRFYHTQEVDPTLRIVAQGNFSSTDFHRQLSEDLRQRLERILRSHLNASKRFNNGSSLALTVSQTRYLDQYTTDTQFPSATFRLPRRPLFAGGAPRGTPATAPGGLAGFGFGSGEPEETPLPAWYENIYVDYGLSLLSTRRSIDRPEDIPQSITALDTTTSQAGLEQRANITYSGKVLGWLNVQPGVSMREAWYLGDTARDGFQRRLLWDSSLRTSTKLYGLADRPLGINASFRHVVEPSLGVVYSPDFSDLPAVPPLYGANPSGQRSLTFSLGQIFQMKRQVDDREVRTDLARVTSSGSYNNRAPGRKLSDVSSSIVMNPGRVLNLQLTLAHRFYAPGTERLQWTPVAQTINYRSSLRLNSGAVGGWLDQVLGRSLPAADPTTGEQQPGEAEAAVDPEQDLPFEVPSSQAGSFFRPQTPIRQPGQALWNLSLGHDYGWTRDSPIKRHSLDGTLTFNIPNWTITWSARYDLSRRELVRQSIDVYRDLHCWEARFQIVPEGPGRGYWFVINIKEIPEIKYEQRRTQY
jgi:hypothetical protein